MGWATRSERLAKLRTRPMQGFPFRGRLGWCLQLPVRRYRRTGIPSWSRVTLQRVVSEPSSGMFGLPRPPSTFGPREPGPWSLPSSAAPRAFSGARSTSTRGFSLSFRVSPKTTPVLRAVFTRPASDQHCPSHGVFIPSAVASTKEPVHPAVPPAGTLRLQGSSPLDALLPFEPSRRFRRGRSWDSHLQGFVPPGDPALFRADPSPPVRCSPHSRHASSVPDWTWSSIEADQASRGTR